MTKRQCVILVASNVVTMIFCIWLGSFLRSSAVTSQSRVLTDEECKTLYLTTLSVLPQYQIPREDVRYRGSTAVADVNNTGREG